MASGGTDSRLILRAEKLTKVFRASGRMQTKEASEKDIRAVDAVSIALNEGETLGVVGESGSGKSTLARLLLGLEEPTSGVVFYREEPVVGHKTKLPRRLRREIQFVAQDPYSSLDPRMTVRRIIGEGWRIHKDVVPRSEQRGETLALLEMVGIHGEDLLSRYPHEFSGGQRQRIAISRALALRPSVLILDEPISSLDVSVQAQVLLLLQELQEKRGLAYLFIAHDLSVVEYFADTVAVMYRGRVVETGPAMDVFTNPRHPYTALLRGSVAEWQRSGKARIQPPFTRDEPPKADQACVFYHRCPFREEICASVDPQEHMRSEGDRRFACHFPIEGP